MEKMNITLSPLVVMIGEKTYHDGVDIAPRDLFQFVERDKENCKMLRSIVRDDCLLKNIPTI
jgi:fatty acid-binding protein DegV